MDTCPILKLCACSPDEICYLCKLLTVAGIGIGCGIIGYILGKNKGKGKKDV